MNVKAADGRIIDSEALEQSLQRFHDGTLQHEQQVRVMAAKFYELADDIHTQFIEDMMNATPTSSYDGDDEPRDGMFFQRADEPRPMSIRTPAGFLGR